MAVINHAKREINAKIVYFGAADSGKSDLFRFIHQRIKPGLCGPLKTMPAGSDTLLFFDYIPFETSSLDGFRIRFHLYTLTGPVANPGTWKMTLKGVDGVAFVTAEQSSGEDVTVESLRQLRSMLTRYGRDLRSLPRLWLRCGKTGEAIANSSMQTDFDEQQKIICSLATGEGVLQSLALLSQAVLQQLRHDYASSATPADTPEPIVHDDDITLPSDYSAHKSSETLTLPEIKLALSRNTTVEIPLTLESGSTVKRCLLSLSLQVEEGSL